MPRGLPGRLDRYGDSMVRSPFGCGDRVARPEGATARMFEGGGAKLAIDPTRSMRYAESGRTECIQWSKHRTALARAFLARKVHGATRE
jgi:hypothetical protein